MQRVLNGLEFVFLLGISSVLITYGALSQHTSLLNGLYPSEYWQLSSETIRTLFFVYGVLFGFLAMASLYLILLKKASLFRKLREHLVKLGREIQRTWKWAISGSCMNQSLGWLALLVAIAALTRLYYLSHPMRYDETYTYVHFVSRSIFHVFIYPVPNNHLFHTVLVRGFVEILGGSPTVLRMPAFLAGLCLIPLIYTFTRLLDHTGRGGYLAAGLVVVSPYLIFYDTNSRGYSLLIMLTMLLAILGLRYKHKPSIQACFLMALCTALGFWVMPPFLFPAAGIYLWVAMMLFARGHRASLLFRDLIVPSGLMTFGLTFLIYTPTIMASNGVQAIVSNRFVQSKAWPELLGLLSIKLEQTIATFTRGIPDGIILGALLLFALGVYSLIKGKRLDMLLLMIALPLACVLVIAVKQVPPHPRTLIYLLPFMFIVMDAGLSLSRLSSLSYLKKGVLIMAVLFSILVMKGNTVYLFSQKGLALLAAP